MDRVLTVTLNPSVDLAIKVGEVVPNHKLRCFDPVRYAGGGGVNVARVIHRLGGSVVAAYATGGDVGRRLRKMLDAEGVEGRVLDLSEETRENVAVWDERNKQDYKFVLPGPHVSESEWRGFLDLVASASRGVRFLVASGSLPPGAPDDFYARCARIAEKAGAAFALDAGGPALSEAIDEHVDIIKPSLRELEALVGRSLPEERDWSDAAQELVSSRRVKTVVVSLGERGAYLHSADFTARGYATAVALNNTVGAGDSFLAGLIWSLSLGGSMEDSLRYAMAAGTATLMQQGTRLCDPQDVKTIADNVVIIARGPRPSFMREEREAMMSDGPRVMPQRLASIDAYWRSLRRGENEIPFSDDLDVTKLGDLADHAALLDVLGEPPRFRFAIIGRHLARSSGWMASGRFLDEVAAASSASALLDQCKETVSGGQPTYREGAFGYRLALPFWGDGRVQSLLVALSASP